MVCKIHGPSREIIIPSQETLETDLHTYQRETLQRMQVSAEACIASLHILTCPDMPKAG